MVLASEKSLEQSIIEDAFNMMFQEELKSQKSLRENTLSNHSRREVEVPPSSKHQTDWETEEELELQLQDASQSAKSLQQPPCIKEHVIEDSPVKQKVVYKNLSPFAEEMISRMEQALVDNDP